MRTKKKKKKKEIKKKNNTSSRRRTEATRWPLEGGAPALKLEMAWRAADGSPVLAAFLEKAPAAAPAEGERGRRGPARN